MGLPDETSWQCENCGTFNISNGRIINGHMYCESCFKNAEELKQEQFEKLNVEPKIYKGSQEQSEGAKLK